ncbi:uncharacterized protein LOC114669633 isoform X1 [Erpetoichthys calabaricus]|uniref:uncharacterized protein LOC114669633 isoform X1 n=1 Tax=Erpetoichthys calabaricus TaxID=27687 RepID=UPI0022343289|nr:uncharacterized protein LOC114669633 isoform X1 [Erpetoichthys calabaricus]
MLIIHFSGVTESILPDFQQNSQIFSHVKEFLSNEGTSKYLLLTLLVMQIFIQHRLFLSEKQQANKKLKMLTAFVLCVLECLIIFGTILWVVKGDCTCLVAVGLTQLVLFFILAKHTSQGFYKMCGVTFAAMLLLIFAFCYLENLEKDVIDNMMTDYQNLANAFVSYDYQYLWKEGQIEPLLLTDIILQIFNIFLAFFLLEKPKVRRKLTVSTISLICVHEFFIIIGIVLWNKKGDSSLILIAVLIQATAFILVLVQAVLQGCYKTLMTVFAMVGILAVLAYADILDKALQLNHYEILAKIFHNCTEQFLWIKGLLIDNWSSFQTFIYAFFNDVNNFPGILGASGCPVLGFVLYLCMQVPLITTKILHGNSERIQNDDLVKRDDNKKWKEEYDALRAKYDDLVKRDDRKKWKEESDALRAKYDDLVKREDNKNWEKEYDALRAKYDDLVKRDDKKKWKEEYDALRAKYDDLVKRDDSKKWKEEYDALRAKYDDLVKRDDSKKWKEEYDALRAKYDDLVKRDDNKKWKKEYDAPRAKYEYDALRAEFDKLGIVPDKVWEKIQECEVDMVLSPDTAHSDISVDNDAAQVRFTGDTKGPNTWCCVTGSDWLKAQQDHYWEVEVGEKGSWAIGLASETIKDEQLIAECPTNELWIIRLCRGKKLEAITRTDVKEYQLKPKKVGLHWEGNCLRVYDKEKKQLIHKFDIEYSEHLYPVFSPGSHDRGPLIIKIKSTETENLKQKFGIALKLNTKYPNIINVDNQQIRLTGKEQVAGDLWHCVLANNKLTSGKAYWEVEVGEKSSWALGVVADTKEVKMSIPDEPEEGFWIIKVQAEKIHAVSSRSIRILRNPRKVGVFVDFVEQELSFYDIEKKYLIHRFHIKSSEKLYPIFSPGVQDKDPLIII